MSERRRPGLFVEQQSYRRRRLRDAARLLPVLLAVLVAVPAYWLAETEAAGRMGTRSVGIYLFAIWGAAVAAAALLALALGDDPGEEG